MWWVEWRKHLDASWHKPFDRGIVRRQIFSSVCASSREAKSSFSRKSFAQIFTFQHHESFHTVGSSSGAFCWNITKECLMFPSKKEERDLGHVFYIRHKSVSFIKSLKKAGMFYKVKDNMEIMGCLCFFGFGWCLFDKLDHIVFIVF